MNYKQFYTSLFQIIFTFLLCSLIFQVFRLLLVFNFGPENIFITNKFELLKAFFYTGFRYDTVVICYILVPFIPLAILNLFIKNSTYISLKNTFLFWFSFFFICLSIIILTTDYYFFKFFQSHFNLLLFGLKDDDTKAVAESMWTDYPVIKIIITWIIIFTAIFYILKYIFKKSITVFPQSHLTNSLVIIIFIALYALGMRGSIGVFTLQKDDATITSNTFINSLTMNGIFSLKDAISDYYEYSINTDIKLTLKKYGYKNQQEAINDFTGNKLEKKSISSYFTDTTSVNNYIAKNPPHVVFCLMESFSNYYLDLHSKTLNLLGEFENQKDSCVIFRNFVSSFNGTIHSLEAMMVNTPITPLSQSPYMKIKLASAVAKIYLEKGYETNFITGANLGWRNLDKYAQTQYFQNLEGSATIVENVKGAQTCDWGAYDEFVFKRVEQILKNARKPQLIFVLSTTNHTPYDLPLTYKPFAIRLTDSVKNNLRCNEEIALKNLTAYQYSTNCIGNFIKNIRNSTLAKNTILSFTGDHNTLALFNFDDKHLLQKRGVPFILYIPQAYKPSSIDLKRFGSHKDIFPTLYNLSLSNTIYFKSGNNLFSNKEENFSSINNGQNEFSLAINIYGCVTIETHPLYFKWENNLLQKTTLRDNPELGNLQKKSKAYLTLLTIYIQEQLESGNKDRH